jgi:spore coat protein U-like protein
MTSTFSGKCALSLALAFALVPSIPPHAATATANLAVSATVVASCSVSSGTLAFGNYDPTATSNLDASTTFQVTCTKGTAATVGMNVGANAQGSTRRMVNGSDYLTYELYQDSGRSTVWGSAGPALLSLSAASSNAAQTVTVYGRVPQSQDAAVGSFADTVVMTVIF